MEKSIDDMKQWACVLKRKPVLVKDCILYNISTT